MKGKYKIAGLFGALHGINDFIAGFMLASLSVNSTDIKVNTITFLVYSIIAFGGQLPAGMLVDKTKKLKLLSLFSVACMIVAVSLFYVNIFYAILFSAIASAFIHVCGGAACYISDNKNVTLAGIFTSPGVVGLIIGGIVATTNFSFFYVLIVVLLLLFILMAKTAFPSYKTIKQNTNNSLLQLDQHDFFMLVLIMAIAFRSLIWNVMHAMCFNNTNWLYAIAFSAFAGKLIGAYIADRTDWKKFVFITMFVSAVLLNAGKDYLPVFCIGVALLQSGVPITLLLMQQYLKNSPATAAGLSLGLSIVIAGLPAYTEQFRLIQIHKILLILLSIAFLASNYAVIRLKKPSV